MKKCELKEVVKELCQTVRWRNGKVAELEKRVCDLLSRARDAETDRRLALELIGKLCNVAPAGIIRDDALAFLKSLMR
jgi:hypothetical protein